MSWRGLLRRLRASRWSHLEPGVQFDRDSFIERWDGRGEGRAWCLSFEGFGLTGCIFIGRTPKVDDRN